MVGKNPVFWKEKNIEKNKIVFSIPVIWIEIIEKNSTEPIPYLCKVFLYKLLKGDKKLPNVKKEYIPTEKNLSKFSNKKIKFKDNVAGRSPLYWIKGVKTRNREFYIPNYWEEKIQNKCNNKIKTNMICIMYIYSLVIKYMIYNSKHPFELLEVEKSKYLDIK